MCETANPQQEAEIENRKAIYEISKAAYEKCYDHTKSLDSKANIFMVVDGFALTALGLLVQNFEGILKDSSHLADVTIFFIIVTVAAILTGLSFFVGSLMLRKFKNLPYPVKTLMTFKDMDLIFFYNNGIIQFHQMLLDRGKKNKKKARLVAVGSYTLYLALLFSLILFILVICNIKQ